MKQTGAVPVITHDGWESADLRPGSPSSWEVSLRHRTANDVLMSCLQGRSGLTPQLLELLRRLTLNDELTVGKALRGSATATPLLDAKTLALVRLAALAAREAETPSYQAAVDIARAAGIEDPEVIETLLCIAPLIGNARTDAAFVPLTELIRLSDVRS